MSQPVELAAGALTRATTFLTEQADQHWLACPWPEQDHVVRTRLVGNWLVELDRLLHVLLDARGEERRNGAPSGTRNTIIKLAASSDDQGWCRPHLLGLSKARAAFRYTQGRALRPDMRGGVVATLGWLASDGHWVQVGIGQRIAFDGDALREICQFYGQLSAQLLDSAG